MSNRHLDEFFSLRCAGDVLGATGPVNNGAKEITEAMAVHNGAKEITEAMAVRKVVQSFALKKKMHYTVYDICAGNGLLGLLVAHTLPVRSTVAIDIRQGHLHLDNVKHYQYLQEDIMKTQPNLKAPSIICAIHPCQGLAERIIDYYLMNEQARKLILMPCCVRSNFKRPSAPAYIQNQISVDDQWVWYLADKAKGVIRQDNRVLSPKNKIIIAEKG
jgi:hypothetical protein